MKKIFILFLFFIGLATLSFAIYRVLHQTRDFPVRVVHVYGAHHVDHKELQNLLTPLVSHNFFVVDMDLIKDRLRQYSWVENIAIRRVWPDQVDVIVTERQPVALWREDSLLSASGDLFSQGGYEDPPGLPQFTGPDGSQGIMLQFFNDVNREIQPLHAKVVRLELTLYQMWRLKLDNGISLRLGNKNILTRIDQFVKLYPKIIGDKAKDVEYVDLRYPNGMAIRWKDEVETS